MSHRLLLPAALVLIMAAPKSTVAQPAEFPKVARQWILVTTPELRESAQPLIERRKGQGWTVDVIELESDAKQWRQVALDLRASLATKYRKFEGNSCVLLLGDWEPTAIPALRGQHGRMLEQATDHGFGLPEEDGTVTVAVGRLPARTPKEAGAMIRKIIAFESSKPAKNQIGVVVGHPGGQSKAQQMLAGSIIRGAVESRLKKLPANWTVDCVMDVEGSKFSVEPQELTAAATRLFSQSQQMIVYSGHSSSSGLSSRFDRFYPRETFAKNSSDGPVGTFFSCGCFGCQISGFDGIGYGVVAIRSPSGPASVIGSYGESYAAPGQLALDGALTCVADGAPPERLGGYWLATLRGITRGKISPAEFYLYDRADGSNGKVSLKDQRLEHAEMWTLLGDPAMIIPVVRAK